MALKNVFGDLALDESVNKAAYLLDTLVALAYALEPSTGRVRTQIDVIPTVTVGNISNLLAVGGLAANSMVLDTMQTTWATAIRPLIP